MPRPKSRSWVALNALCLARAKRLLLPEKQSLCEIDVEGETVYLGVPGVVRHRWSTAGDVILEPGGNWAEMTL